MYESKQVGIYGGIHEFKYLDMVVYRYVKVCKIWMYAGM